ncbi:serine/threonine-protein kinase [Halalkaliarchaeum desulfuricum]|uniref:Serine/threonine-protein kinase n=1 Tax=Halalkaliarchaeum desulfuricum TaxID=2055893 RepID=A0A343TP44_9EURY|nr:PASTA domain-containing protein [Halalkaliarchaeum desulfuricum]AUX10866.1 serine/threonine-protein kinase [Halalkaliarchaeum desulfuricum]
MTDLETLIRSRYPSVDVDKLDRREQYELAGAVRNQQRLVESIQDRLVDVEIERDMLSTKVDRLVELRREAETERDRLRDRIEELTADIPAVEPDRVVTAFANSIGDFEELERSGYSVSNLEVDLKASLVQRDDGMALHLPRLTEEYSADSLSTIRFGVRPTPPQQDLELVRVPHVVGRSRETARQLLAEADLSVGRIESVPGDPGDMVVDQFPKSGDLADPGAGVDVVVTEATSVDVPSCLGLRLAEARTALAEAGLSVGEIERVPADAPDGTVVEQHPPPTDDTDRGAAVDLVLAETEKEDEEEREEREEREAKEREERGEPVRTVPGIGPTYAERLQREGIETVPELVRLDPARVASITEAGEGRVRRWLEELDAVNEDDGRGNDGRGNDGRGNDRRRDDGR